jgi:hypothetical protein
LSDGSLPPSEVRWELLGVPFGQAPVVPENNSVG